MNYPQNLINDLPTEQRDIFVKMLGKKENEEIVIVKELSNFINPLKGVFQSQLSYSDILKKTANHFDIEISNHFDLKKVEEDIFIFKIKENFQSLPEEDQKRIQDEFLKLSELSNINANQIKALGTIGALTAANLSGFGMYLMASTVVGGVSGALGITLPFAFYTAMSSFLSFITGLIGWTIGLGTLVYSLRNENLESISGKLKGVFNATKNLFTGNYEMATAIIVQICANRIILNEKFSREIKEIEIILNLKKENKQNLELQLSDIEKKIAELKDEKNAIYDKINNTLVELSDSKMKIEILKSRLY